MIIKCKDMDNEIVDREFFYKLIDKHDSKKKISKETNKIKKELDKLININ